MAKKKKLTASERTFVLEYSKSFNAAEAYRKAFPKNEAKFSKQYAHKLLGKESIKEAFEEAVEQAVGPFEKDLVQNIKFWIETRDNKGLKMSERLKASEYLSKYRGLFTEKHEHTGAVAVSIVDDI